MKLRMFWPLSAVICISGAMGLWVLPVRGQRPGVKIEGMGVKKTWGPIRGNYFNARERALVLIFEDASGTVRLVAIRPETSSAELLTEMRRE